MRSDERIASASGTHLSDDQLMESYVLAGENRHLAGCASCAARFDDLVHALHQVREDAVREADNIFTGERLHVQRDRIMRRLERHGHPAEVVMFPSRAASHTGVGHVRRVLGPARRWVAAAAAAGLAAGIFLGFAMDRRTHYAAMGQAVRPPAATAVAAAWQAAGARDDQFFTEIDDALMGSRANELRAIDTMTTPVEIREASYPR
jgi:hypothetical protein